MRLAVDGREAYAYTGGKAFDPRLPLVVFVHGALHDHSVWNLAARRVAHHGRAVLAPDQPAHGRSAGPALGDVGALADWVLAVADAAGHDPAAGLAVVGHSLGSLVALECAARAPARVRALVLVATAFPMKVSAALLDAAASRPDDAIAMVDAFTHSTYAAKPSFPGPGVWLSGANRALMRRTLGGPSARMASAQASPNLFHHDFALCDRYAGGLDAAARVRCPTTVVVGERDQMTPPAAAAEIARALRADVVRLPCGHAVMSEAPDGFGRALEAALARALPVAAPA